MGTLGRGGHRQGVLLDALGLGEQERFQRPPLDLLEREELRHGVAAHQGNVAAEQHPIEAGQHTADRVRMLGHEGIHGANRTPLSAAKQAAALHLTSRLAASGRQPLGCGRRSALDSLSGQAGVVDGTPLIRRPAARCQRASFASCPHVDITMLGRLALSTAPNRHRTTCARRARA